jgi:drug/metabolite transporter (DMT)-like permease
VCSAKLQQSGLGSWAVLKGQGATAAILTVPMTALLVVLGFVDVAGTHADVAKRSVEAGAVNAIAFTIVPLYLWYRGIARCGLARTSICCFAEPLVATLLSLFLLRDAPATPALIAGVVLILAATVASAADPDRR